MSETETAIEEGTKSDIRASQQYVGKERLMKATRPEPSKAIEVEIETDAPTSAKANSTRGKANMDLHTSAAYEKKKNYCIEGPLLKLGRNYVKWRQRYFVMKNDRLEYYLTPCSPKPRGYIPLTQVTHVAPTSIPLPGSSSSNSSSSSSSS